MRVHKAWKRENMWLVRKIASFDVVPLNTPPTVSVQFTVAILCTLGQSFNKWQSKVWRKILLNKSDNTVTVLLQFLSVCEWVYIYLLINTSVCHVFKFQRSYLHKSYYMHIYYKIKFYMSASTVAWRHMEAEVRIHVFFHNVPIVSRLVTSFIFRLVKPQMTDYKAIFDWTGRSNHKFLERGLGK